MGGAQEKRGAEAKKGRQQKKGVEAKKGRQQQQQQKRGGEREARTAKEGFCESCQTEKWGRDWPGEQHCQECYIYEHEVPHGKITGT